MNTLTENFILKICWLTVSYSTVETRRIESIKVAGEMVDVAGKPVTVLGALPTVLTVCSVVSRLARGGLHSARAKLRIRKQKWWCTYIHTYSSK